MNDLEKAAIAYSDAWNRFKAADCDTDEWRAASYAIEKSQGTMLVVARAFAKSLETVAPGLDPTLVTLAREVLAALDRTTSLSMAFEPAYVKVACRAAEILARAVLDNEERERAWKQEAASSDSPALRAYKLLEQASLVLDDTWPFEAGKVRDAMDPIWRTLAKDERAALNARGIVASEALASAEAYARGRVDGIEAEKKAGVAVYESREAWAKRTTTLETHLCKMIVLAKCGVDHLDENDPEHVDRLVKIGAAESLLGCSGG